MQQTISSLEDTKPDIYPRRCSIILEGKRIEKEWGGLNPLQVM
jgi:hypothetical protein